MSLLAHSLALRWQNFHGLRLRRRRRSNRLAGGGSGGELHRWLAELALPSSRLQPPLTACLARHSLAVTSNAARHVVRRRPMGSAVVLATGVPAHGGRLVWEVQCTSLKSTKTTTTGEQRQCCEKKTTKKTPRNKKR